MKYTSSAYLELGETAVYDEATEYLPAIFTAKDDNTIGQAIPGSTGNPTNSFYANPAIYFTTPGGTWNFSNFRIDFAATAFSLSSSYNLNVNLSDGQIVNCGTVIYTPGIVTLGLENLLLANFQTAFELGAATNVSAQNVTFASATGPPPDYNPPVMAAPISYPYSSDTISLTNCILANFIALDWIPAFNFNAAYCGFYNNDFSAFGSSHTNASSNPFQTAGAGYYYLYGSSFTNAGTTNIDPSLLSNLRTMTVCPPITNASFASNYVQVITNATTLGPGVSRDTNAAPALGYHYAPIDYMTTCDYSNTTVTLTNGVVIGYWRDLAIQLDNGSQLVSQGTPVQRNIIAYYNLVQEQPVKLMSGDTNLNDYPSDSLPINTYHSNSNQNPSINLRLTSIYAPQTAVNILSSYSNTEIGNLALRDCETYGSGAQWQLEQSSGAVGLTNNLFQYSTVYATLDVFNAFNNLCRGDTNDWFEFATDGGGSIAVTNQDNAFDGGNVELGGTMGYNAYLNGAIVAYSSAQCIDITTNLTWVSGQLGSFYQPHQQPAHYQRERVGRATRSLHHYTTQTSQVPRRQRHGIHRLPLRGVGRQWASARLERRWHSRLFGGRQRRRGLRSRNRFGHLVPAAGHYIADHASHSAKNQQQHSLTRRNRAGTIPILFPAQFSVATERNDHYKRNFIELHLYRQQRHVRDLFPHDYQRGGQHKRLLAS